MTAQENQAEELVPPKIAQSLVTKRTCTWRQEWVHSADTTMVVSIPSRYRKALGTCKKTKETMHFTSMRKKYTISCRCQRSHATLENACRITVTEALKSSELMCSCKQSFEQFTAEKNWSFLHNGRRSNVQTLTCSSWVNKFRSKILPMQLYYEVHLETLLK